MPWYFAAWKPERTLACISFSGQWPYVPDEKNAPHVAGRSVDSVPGIVTSGEYEWADESMPRGLKMKSEHPQIPISGLGCPADGHFAAMDEKVDLLSLYLKKAAEYRLPKKSSGDGPVILNPIDPSKSGWLVDRYRSNQNPLAPAAPVAQYKGDPAQAFWYFRRGNRQGRREVPAGTPGPVGVARLCAGWSGGPTKAWHASAGLDEIPAAG